MLLLLFFTFAMFNAGFSIARYIFLYILLQFIPVSFSPDSVLWNSHLPPSFCDSGAPSVYNGHYMVTIVTHVLYALFKYMFKLLCYISYSVSTRTCYTLNFQLIYVPFEWEWSDEIF